jgi:hypothetical protein
MLTATILAQLLGVKKVDYTKASYVEACDGLNDGKRFGLHLD